MFHIACRTAFMILVAAPLSLNPRSVVPPDNEDQCKIEPPTRDLSRFDAVFSGQLLSDGNLNPLLFRQYRVWKGPIQKELSITNEPMPSSSKIAFSKGADYLVYAQRSTASLLAIPGCSRTNLLQQAAPDLAILGEGTSAADVIALSKTWDHSGEVAIRELKYLNWHDGSDQIERRFRFPIRQAVTLQAFGPPNLKILILGYLSIEAQDLYNIERLGPRDRRIIVELSDKQSASFTTADPIDALSTELIIPTVRTLPKSAHLGSAGETKGQSGQMNVVRDSTDHPTGAAISSLDQGFTMRITWNDTTTTPPTPTKSWRDDLDQINKLLQGDPRPDPDCDDEKTVEPQRLSVSGETISLASHTCRAGGRTQVSFPTLGLDIARIQAEVWIYTPSLDYLQPSHRITISVPCTTGRCGRSRSQTQSDQPMAESSLELETTFKPGLARQLQFLLQHLITRLQSSRAR